MKPMMEGTADQGWQWGCIIACVIKYLGMIPSWGQRGTLRVVGRVQCPCLESCSYQEHGGGEDIAVQVIAQEVELQAIASLHPRVSTSLNPVSWAPHPSPSHVNKNVMISQDIHFPSSPRKSCSFPQYRASLYYPAPSVSLSAPVYFPS